MVIESQGPLPQVSVNANTDIKRIRKSNAFVVSEINTIIGN